MSRLPQAAQPAAAGPAAAKPAMSATVKGLIAMALSMALFVTNDTFLKLSIREIPLGEALGLRSFLAGIVLFVLIVRAGDLPALRYAFHPRVVMRSTLDTLTTFVYVAALAVMAIASSTTIYMATPLITTALAVPMLGEKVGWRSWCAIVVGFCGAVIVTRPDPSTFEAIAILPLLAALFGAIRDVSTRGIGREIPGTVVGFSGTLVLCATAAVFMAWESWKLPPVAVMAYIVASGVAFAGGTLCLVFAFRNAPVASVSPLRYLLVFGALVSGYFVFGDLPDAWTTVGMVLVVGAGLYAVHREHEKSRAARRAAAGASGLGAAAPGCRPAAACAPARD
ncbi:DMT family transporter [Xanthobacter versatilis]|uniref:DMT family transporter n=1 Tax=Xanthobacter autotrophicus (strain ATCC BAA-1158 / Py2) TaxID=78245 RepID=UPI003727CA9C